MQYQDIQSLKAHLQQSGDDFHIISDEQGQEIHFQFLGKGLNEDDPEVLWNGQLLTLSRYLKNHQEKLSQQKMTVQKGSEQQYEIQIVLKLDQLTTVSVLMAITMVRQYKRLSLGSHYWN